MARMSNAAFRRKLNEILMQGIRQAGVRARIEIEPIPSTNLSRVYIVSNQRDNLGHTEWHNLIWRLIREAFGADANSRITTIYTVTPAELRRYRANEAAETARA